MLVEIMDDIVAYLLARKKWESAPIYKKIMWVIAGTITRIWKPAVIVLVVIAIVKFIWF